MRMGSFQNFISLKSQQNIISDNFCFLETKLSTRNIQNRKLSPWQLKLGQITFPPAEPKRCSPIKVAYAVTSSWGSTQPLCSQVKSMRQYDFYVDYKHQVIAMESSPVLLRNNSHPRNFLKKYARIYSQLKIVVISWGSLGIGK